MDREAGHSTASPARSSPLWRRRSLSWKNKCRRWVDQVMTIMKLLSHCGTNVIMAPLQVPRITDRLEEIKALIDLAEDKDGGDKRDHLGSDWGNPGDDVNVNTCHSVEIWKIRYNLSDVVVASSAVRITLLRHYHGPLASRAGEERARLLAPTTSLRAHLSGDTPTRLLTTTSNEGTQIKHGAIWDEISLGPSIGKSE